jgi:hypothetical protein
VVHSHMPCKNRISSVERCGFISVEKHPIGETVPGENPEPPWRGALQKHPDAKSSTSSQPQSISGGNDEQMCSASIASRPPRLGRYIS